MIYSITFKYYVIKEVGGWGCQMMMLDDKVGGWGWLRDLSRDDCIEEFIKRI